MAPPGWERGPPSPGRVPRPTMELLSPPPPIHSWGMENSTQSTGQVGGLKTGDRPPVGSAGKPSDRPTT